MRQISESIFLVTDLETTGLSPERHRVTEVACVLVQDGEIVDERQTLVNPEQFIPHAIQQMTGITNAMVLGAPKGEEAFPRVRGWIDDASAFVAHNVSFDYNFLQHSFRRHGLAGMPVPKLCTARLARRLFPRRGSYSLGQLAGYLGIRVHGRHTALGDARATAKLLVKMLEMLQGEHGLATLEEVVSFQHRTMGAFVTPPRNVQSLAPVLAEVPSTPGVYRMLDKRGEIMYIGKAKSLRERVGSYFRPGADHPKKIAEMIRRVHAVETEETGSELSALLLESKLIKEYQPRFNTMLKRTKHYRFVRIDPSDPFPPLDVVGEIEADGAEYFGPFRGRHAAELVVETIDGLFKLRKCAEMPGPRPDIVPCFYHQIRRCDAPCAMMQNREEYGVELDRVRRFLSSSETGIIVELESRMGALAEEMRFEEAAELRNRAFELRRIFSGRSRVADSINANNVVIVLPSPDPGKKELFMIRFGRLERQLIVGKRAPRVTIGRLIERVYFDGATAPPNIRREEVEEIRIIASYLHQHRDEGRFVSIEPEMTVQQVVEQVVSALEAYGGKA